MTSLKYVGNGAIPGIPARDLTAEEVKKYGGEKFLVGTGQYKATSPKQSEKKDGGK